MMEPTQLYNHSKRNLLVFAVILALVLFRGIEATNSAQLFGFKVRPEVLPTALFFVVGYLVYQFFLARTFQADELRNRTWLWLDFAITTGFASVVLLGYLILYLFYQVLGFGLSAGLVILPIVVSAVAVVFVLSRSAEWVKWRREAIDLRAATIEPRLKEPGWILNYNPKIQGGTKQISFNDDGSIGEGKNPNEHSWRLVGNKLEILNADGERQNLFQYDPSTDQFKSLGRAKAFNIEGQYIYREAH
jgi:hypothetical protein